MAQINASGFSEIEHTADWALRVWAPDLVGLFREAARGMYSLMELALEPGSSAEGSLDLRADDAESLLVLFLSELLYDCEDDQVAFDTIDLSIEDVSLHARLKGAHFREQRKEIKAVTYHKLAIQNTPVGLEVTIVFDV